MRIKLNKMENEEPSTVLKRLQFSTRKTSTGCWEWTGGKGAKGYGQIYVFHKKWRTHRLGWFLTNGPIPEGKDVLHHCDNPPCWNPDHLFIGDDAINMEDKLSKQGTNSPRSAFKPESPEDLADERRDRRKWPREKVEKAVSLRLGGMSLREASSESGIPYGVLAQECCRRRIVRKRIKWDKGRIGESVALRISGLTLRECSERTGIPVSVIWKYSSDPFYTGKLKDPPKLEIANSPVGAPFTGVPPDVPGASSGPRGGASARSSYHGSVKEPDNRHENPTPFKATGVKGGRSGRADPESIGVPPARTPRFDPVGALLKKAAKQIDGEREDIVKEDPDQFGHLWEET